MTIWVAVLHVSPATAQKISGRHHISEHEIRDAVQCVSGLMYTWNEHPVRGRRAIVEVFIREQRVLLVLYPRPDPYGDVWDLGSAYPIGD